MVFRWLKPTAMNLDSFIIIAVPFKGRISNAYRWLKPTA